MVTLVVAWHAVRVLLGSGRGADGHAGCSSSAGRPGRTTQVPGRATSDVLLIETDFERHARSTYQTARQKSVGTILLALLFLLVLQALDNPQAFPIEGNVRWRELFSDSHVPLDRATDITLALLAVEATLSIALAVAAPRPSQGHDVRDYVVAFAWAHVGVVVTVVTSALALAVALTQWFNDDSTRQPATVMVLSLVGFLAVALSAAITSYTGQAVFDRLQTRRSLARLDAVPGDFAVVRRSEARSSPLVAFGFSLAVGTAVSVLVITVQLMSGSAGASSLPWQIRFLGVAAFVASSAAVMVGLTSGLWRSWRGTSVVDLWMSRLLRGAFVLGMTATLALAGLSSSAPSHWLQLGLVWTGGLWVPAALLRAARRTGRGPAAFAVRSHVEWESRRRGRLQQILREDHATPDPGPR